LLGVPGAQGPGQLAVLATNATWRGAGTFTPNATTMNAVYTPTAAQIADARSIGLVGMRERAQAFGGNVEITSVPGGGTTVRVRIPLDRKNATDSP